MTGVIHLDGTRGYVYVLIIVEIRLEGVEVALGLAVLIGEVDVHVACPEANATGEAVGVLPIDIIGRRSIHHAWRGDAHVTVAVLVVG